MFITSVKKFRVINFHGFHYPQKNFNNKIFQDCGSCLIGNTCTVISTLHAKIFLSDIPLKIYLHNYLTHEYLNTQLFQYM